MITPSKIDGFSVEEATIEGVHRAMIAGEITAEALTKAYLARIAAYDSALNAIISVNPEALAVAQKLDAHYRHTQQWIGPLHGIPVLLKDNINTQEMPTTAGSLSLAGYIPPYEASIVTRLKEAGAIILAKANLHEFAIWGESVSSLGGQVYNPYDLTRTPGGSSGGTGAGLAANFAMLGVGTDTVNSIRSPASANALVGLRPTLGLVSRYGLVPYSQTQDTAGPMARTVSDVAYMLNVLSAEDPKDSVTQGHDEKRVMDYTAFLKTKGLFGKRIGVLFSYFGKASQHEAVNILINEALQVMDAAGAELILVDTIPAASTLVDEISVHLYDLKPDLNAYLQADPRSPVKSLAEIIASGQYHPGIEENIKAAEKLDRSTPAYKKRLMKQRALQETVLNVMDEHQLEALVFPHQQCLVVPVGGEAQRERNGSLAAVTGFPALVVPAGFSARSAEAPIGVPVGLEIVGRPWAEGTLIEIGYSYEALTQHRSPPPFTPPLG